MTASKGEWKVRSHTVTEKTHRAEAKGDLGHLGWSTHWQRGSHGGGFFPPLKLIISLHICHLLMAVGGLVSLCVSPQPSIASALTAPGVLQGTSVCWLNESFRDARWRSAGEHRPLAGPACPSQLHNPGRGSLRFSS